MQYPLIIKQGETFRLRFYCYQADGITSVGDLTGFSVTGKMRSSLESSTVVATFTGVVVTASTALCEISFTAAETAALTAGSCVYDVEVYSGSTTYRPLEGFVTVTREVTR